MPGIISYNDSLLLRSQLGKTTREMQSSVIKLATGEKVNQPSDDVAAYAIGTSLNSQITAINAGLNSVMQAQSMLGTASDNLQTIFELLQTQQGLASQASSGTLSSSELAAVNAQFVDISSQIDQIATNTTYNSIPLLDGSLGDASVIVTDTSFDSSIASGTAVIVSALTAAQTFTIGTTTFTANAAGLLGIDVTVATTPTLQATAIVSAISTLLNYNGTTASLLTAKANLGQFIVTNPSAATLLITSAATGTVSNSIIVESSQAAANLTLNGANAGGSAGLTLANGTNGALNAGTFSSGATAYSGTATAIAQGFLSAGLLTSMTVTAESTTGIDVSNISNNPQFIGTIPAISADYVTSNSVNLSVTVGEYTYMANGVNTDYIANTIVAFTSTTAGGGSFNLQFAANGGMSVNDANDATTFVGLLNNTLSTVNIYQTRNITNFAPAGIVYPTGSTTASGNLGGATFQLTTNNFNNIKVDSVEVISSVAGNAAINITINGEVYTSGFNPDGSTNAISNSITTASGSSGKIGFVSQTNPNNIFSMKYVSATALSISSVADAQGLQQALAQTFGLSNVGGNTNAGINIQVGSNSSDVINFTIGGAATQNLYLDDNGNYSDISVSNSSNATAAATVLSNAMATILYLQAEVGAKVNRFDYAQATMESTIANLDAARSGVMDTDVVGETNRLTNLMTKYSAAILSLAQLNNMKYSLLKLLDK